jgi:pimeloyl-ACP methyl ester carboxylesterase
VTESTEPVRRKARGRLLCITLCGALAVLVTTATVAAQDSGPPARLAAPADFAGLVDIGGGRRMYLECRGSGGPTVILVSGWPNTGGVWHVLYPDDPGPAVLPGVAAFTRVCAFDRPGTVLPMDPPAEYPQSRSDSVPQPTTVEHIVADLHALLRAAGVPEPYVLAAHSLGGLLARYYAATYPDEVVGLVLVDTLSEGMRAALTPDQWAIWLGTNGVPTPEELALYPAHERLDIDAAISAVVRAAAAQPPRPLPVVVLEAGHWPDVPQYLQDALAANQAYLATLVPDTRHAVVLESGHAIHVEQPRVVIDAIRQVVAAVRDPSTWPVAAAPVDIAGLVDIGGRRLYLECQGTGSPTIVLEDGAGLGADIWSMDLVEPARPRPMVLPTVAGFTRVCAYDRPGIALSVNPATYPPELADQPTPSRSDPAPMPRAAGDLVADLHALLQAARIPGPYVLAGHSFGGLVARLYASTYPDEVVGLVLVDAANEETYAAWEALLGPTRWAEVMTRTEQPPAGLEGYQDFERLDLNESVAQGRQARASRPLHPMPLAVLTHGRPFEALVPDWPSDAFEHMWLGMQQDLATLVPQPRLTIASQSGHGIQQDQPAVVIEAIRQVVAGVWHPDTWYDLAACCTP